MRNSSVSKGYPSKGFRKPLKGMDAFQERHGCWSLAIFKKRTKHVVIASEVKQPSTEF
jgi:hypothetical protein